MQVWTLTQMVCWMTVQNFPRTVLICSWDVELIHLATELEILLGNVLLWFWWNGFLTYAWWRPSRSTLKHIRSIGLMLIKSGGMPLSAWMNPSCTVIQECFGVVRRSGSETTYFNILTKTMRFVRLLHLGVHPTGEMQTKIWCLEATKPSVVWGVRPYLMKKIHRNHLVFSVEGWIGWLNWLDWLDWRWLHKVQDWSRQSFEICQGNGDISTSWSLGNSYILHACMHHWTTCNSPWIIHNIRHYLYLFFCFQRFPSEMIWML